MTVIAFTHLRNEISLIDFWLRHYAAFCTHLHIYDDGSTDGTRELVQAHPNATLHSIDGGLDEAALLELAYREYGRALWATWAIWVDADEFVYHPRIKDALAYWAAQPYSVIRPAGFNIIADGLPADDGVRQIWELSRQGVPAPVYSKPCVFRPEAGPKWGNGKHALATPQKVNPWGNPYKPDPWRLRLLHYRYLGAEYTAKRNARQFDRSTNKATAWSCAPEYTGEHSPQWAEAMKEHAYDVVADEACWKLTRGVWPKLPTDAK